MGNFEVEDKWQPFLYQLKAHLDLPIFKDDRNVMSPNHTVMIVTLMELKLLQDCPANKNSRGKLPLLSTKVVSNITKTVMDLTDLTKTLSDLSRFLHAYDHDSQWFIGIKPEV